MTLVRLLETRGPTAREAAKVIGDAIANKGKLDLGKGPGRSSAKNAQIERAMAVGGIMGSHNMERPEAIQKLSAKIGQKISTITKDCQHHARLVDSWRRVMAAAPEYKRLYVEFRELLRTFTHEDGSRFSERDVDGICDTTPAALIRIYVTRIRNGPLRRDETFLETVLSDK